MTGHATIADVEDAHKFSPEAQQRLAAYLVVFHKPIKSERSIDCPCCGAAIFTGGGVLDALCSTFRWGMAHGEGYCVRCKWPFRLYHWVRLDQPDVQRFVYPLAFRVYADEELTQETDPAADRTRRLADAEA